MILMKKYPFVDWRSVLYSERDANMATDMGQDHHIDLILSNTDKLS